MIDADQSVIDRWLYKEIISLKQTSKKLGKEIIESADEHDELKKLIDYILKNHFAHVKPARHLEKEDWVLAMFANIVDSTGEH